MFSLFLSNLSVILKKPLSSALYIFDCITYTIVFFSLFIFVSYLSSNNVSGETQFFDILIFTITLVQLIRPALLFFIKETDSLVRESSLAVVFTAIYIFFYQMTTLVDGNITNFPLIFKIRTIIEIFFYTLYIFLTFSRVSPFLRSIRMDFLYSFTFGFIFLIFFGTWLLSLPICRVGDISLFNLLFMATSSVTVTGLAVIDITTQLTPYGHLVLIGLIQIGGLGILTFSTLYMINLKERLSFEERTYTAGLFATKQIQDVNTLLKWIILSTFGIELIGAFFIFVSTLNLNMDPSYRIFFAIFHSIAGFCNAGVSLISSNMRYFYDNPLMIYTISTLIILGGLGFITLLEIRKKLLSVLQFKNRKNSRQLFLSTQTKIILILTLIFLVLGTFAFYFLEKDNTLAHMSSWEKFNNSFFASTLTRTAGFQSFSVVNLKDSTFWVFILFMFIGTAPNSTGGGLKLTTLFVLLWSLGKIATRRSENQQPFLGINISSTLVAKAGSILFLRLSIIVIAVFFMSLYETVPIDKLIFEVTSAFSTVGLTQNLTPSLSLGSKGILMILMFVGRVGSFYILSNLFPFKLQKLTISRKMQSFSLE